MKILTHWGRVTHICVNKLTIIGSDNGLSPDRRQAIILTNAGILLIGPLGTNTNEILIEILTFLFMKNAFESVVCETAAILSRPQCVKEKNTSWLSWDRFFKSSNIIGSWFWRIVSKSRWKMRWKLRDTWVFYCSIMIEDIAGKIP